MHPDLFRAPKHQKSTFFHRGSELHVSDGLLLAIKINDDITAKNHVEPRTGRHGMKEIVSSEVDFLY
jgi:hypothetical protein